jgi:hypothetical protein
MDAGMKFSPNGKFVMVHGSDGYVHQFDAFNGARIFSVSSGGEITIASMPSFIRVSEAWHSVVQFFIF